MGRLDGKIAIITGAGSGMGQAAATLFGREDAKLVLADVNAANGEAVAQEVRDAGGQAVFVKTDVRFAADCQRMVSAALESYGGLNVLVANAGIRIAGTAETLTEEQWDIGMGINLKGVWLCCKYAIPELRKAGGGSIVCTSSGAAFRGAAGAPAYCASKAGVLLLAQSMALDLAKQNIRVNCIAPGPTETRFFGGMTAEEVRERAGWVPMGRMARPEEIAKAMLYLASDESSFVTGACLAVDGGYLA